MNTSAQKVKVEEAFSMFNEQQAEAIKLIIRNRFWGGTDQEFADNKLYYAYGFYTNMPKGKGKEYSGLMSGISKKVKASGTNLILMRPDFWNDGSGDMILFNMELMDEEDLMNWSNQ